jgi:hypothetical protein
MEFVPAERYSRAHMDCAGSESLSPQLQRFPTYLW